VIRPHFAPLACLVFAFGVTGAGYGGEPEQDFRWKFSAGRKLVYELKQAESWKPSGATEQRSSETMRITFVGLGDGTAIVFAKVPSGSVGLEIPGPRTIPVPYYHILGIVGEDGACTGPLAKDVNLLAAIFPLSEKKVAKGSEWPLNMKLTAPSPEPAEAAKETRKESAAAKLEAVAGEGDKAVARISVTGSAEQVAGRTSGKLSFTSQAGFNVGKGRFEAADFTMVREETTGSGEKAKKSTRSASGSVKLIEDAAIDANGKELLAWKQVREALTQAGKGQTEEAAAAFAKALELKDDLPGVRLNLVPLYARLGKFEPAFECLAKEEKLHPGNKDQIFVYAAILYLDAEKELGKEKRDKLFDELGKKYPMSLLGAGGADEPDEGERGASGVRS